MKLKNIYYIPLLWLVSQLAHAQSDAMINSMHERFGLYSERAVQEKLYVHVDRPFYLVGETVWFKAYVLSGSTHSFLDLSKIAYLEILDVDNNPVAQTKFSVLGGKGNGALTLPATIISGKYKLRCYTNWMKNYSADQFFETAVSIVNPFVRFEPDRTAKSDARHDVQFFPEGGRLVNGIESVVAFRAISANGTGIRFNGAIVNSQNDTVARFSPAVNGIGKFTFLPQKGDQYKAFVTDTRNVRAEYAFPAIEEQGYVMYVKDSTENLIRVTVSARVDSEEPSSVYMLCHTRQGVPVIEKKSLKQNVAVFALDKSKLGEGVSHITIFNDKVKPVCERLYFKRPAAKLGIETNLAKTYISRERVALNLSASEASNLSVSIFMDDEIEAGMQENIDSYIWLTSDLKGSIESPGYYFENVSKETDEQLDNLMLTHGWRRFKWDQIFGSQQRKFDFLPEYDGHFITGKMVHRENGKPGKGKEAFLAALDVPARLYGTYSDQEGNVSFEVRRFVGPKEITIQPNLSVDSAYKFEMASPFSKQFSSNPLPPFYFDKTLENQLLTRSINMQTGNAYVPRVYEQKKATLTDTLAFFGKPDEKYFLDEFTRFPTMEEVLREYVKGILVRRRQKEFHFRMIDKLLPNTFYTTDPLMLIDGIPVFDADKIIEFDPLKVKKIELLSSRYFLGPMTFTGIVSFSTYGNDLGGFDLDPGVQVMPYEGVQAQREFYAPKYDSGNANSRVPDFRNLLLWAPNIVTDQNGKASLDFYTSDQTGKYHVVVQGITGNGTTGTYKFSFEVGKRNF